MLDVIWNTRTVTGFILILVMTIFWYIFIWRLEEKQNNANNEVERYDGQAKQSGQSEQPEQ